MDFRLRGNDGGSAVLRKIEKCLKRANFSPGLTGQAEW